MREQRSISWASEFEAVHLAMLRKHNLGTKLIPDSNIPKKSNAQGPGCWGRFDGYMITINLWLIQERFPRSPSGCILYCSIIVSKVIVHNI